MISRDDSKEIGYHSTLLNTLKTGICKCNACTKSSLHDIRVQFSISISHDEPPLEFCVTLMYKLVLHRYIYAYLTQFPTPIKPPGNACVLDVEVKK